MSNSVATLLHQWKHLCKLRAEGWEAVWNAYDALPFKLEKAECKDADEYEGRIKKKDVQRPFFHLLKAMHLNGYLPQIVDPRVLLTVPIVAGFGDTFLKEDNPLAKKLIHRSEQVMEVFEECASVADFALLGSRIRGYANTYKSWRLKDLSAGTPTSLFENSVEIYHHARNTIHRLMAHEMHYADVDKGVLHPHIQDEVDHLQSRMDRVMDTIKRHGWEKKFDEHPMTVAENERREKAKAALEEQAATTIEAMLLKDLVTKLEKGEYGPMISLAASGIDTDPPKLDAFGICIAAINHKLKCFMPLPLTSGVTFVNHIQWKAHVDEMVDPKHVIGYLSHHIDKEFAVTVFKQIFDLMHMLVSAAEAEEMNKELVEVVGEMTGSSEVPLSTSVGKALTIVFTRLDNMEKAFRETAGLNEYQKKVDANIRDLRK